MPCDRGVKEVVRIIDLNKMARQVYKRKFKENHQLINLRARCQFHSATRCVVKYMIGFNHYEKRHKEINYNLPSSECPRCEEIKTWSYIV